MNFSSPIIEVDHSEREPEAITQIRAGTFLQIEQMNDGEFWMRIGTEEFSISTKKRGKVIITRK
jgi:hypothetical protein